MELSEELTSVMVESDEVVPRWCRCGRQWRPMGLPVTGSATLSIGPRVRTVGFVAAQVNLMSGAPCPHLLLLALCDRGPPAMSMG
jgi:hypothetical protein